MHKEQWKEGIWNKPRLYGICHTELSYHANPSTDLQENEVIYIQYEMSYPISCRDFTVISGAVFTCGLLL